MTTTASNAVEVRRIIVVPGPCHAEPALTCGFFVVVRPVRSGMFALGYTTAPCHCRRPWASPKMMKRRTSSRAALRVVPLAPSDWPPSAVEWTRSTWPGGPPRDGLHRLTAGRRHGHRSPQGGSRERDRCVRTRRADRRRTCSTPTTSSPSSARPKATAGVNDYTRILADRAFRDVLLERAPAPLAEIKEIPMVWSGGTDGILTPHATIFANVEAHRARAASRRRLRHERHDPPRGHRPAGNGREGGRWCQGRDEGGRHRRSSRRPLRPDQDAAAHDRNDQRRQAAWPHRLHRGPARVDERLQRNRRPRHRGRARRDRDAGGGATSATTSPVLLGGLVLVRVSSSTGRRRWWSATSGASVVATASATASWTTPSTSRACTRRFASAGLDLPERARADDLGGALVNVFLKCEADPSGRLRGRRQVSLDDSDVHHHRHIKAAVGGVVAAAVGDSAIFVSVAALHQGPSGGGPVAAIVDLG